jgi:hypothetical protein
MSTRRFNVSLPGLPKVGLYVSLLLLPGGFIGLLLVCWLERRVAGGKPNGKARMWYSQMRGWRDLLPGLWRLVKSTPKLQLDLGAGAPAKQNVDLAARYISA